MKTLIVAGSNGSAGAMGPTGPAGTLSTTFFEFNTIFDNGNDNGVDLFFSPLTAAGSNGGAPTVGSASRNFAIVPLACAISQLRVGALLTMTGNAAEVSTFTLCKGTGAAFLSPTATAVTCTTVAAGDILSLKLHESRIPQRLPSSSMQFISDANRAVQG